MTSKTQQPRRLAPKPLPMVWTDFSKADANSQLDYAWLYTLYNMELAEKTASANASVPKGKGQFEIPLRSSQFRNDQFKPSAGYRGSNSHGIGTASLAKAAKAQHALGR